MHTEGGGGGGAPWDFPPLSKVSPPEQSSFPPSALPRKLNQQSFNNEIMRKFILQCSYELDKNEKVR